MDNEKTTYNLTIFQRIFVLPIVKIMWLGSDPSERKSWHLVKKSMEKHEHKYTIPQYDYGMKFLKCEHEGCVICIPVYAPKEPKAPVNPNWKFEELGINNYEYRMYDYTKGWGEWMRISDSSAKRLKDSEDFEIRVKVQL